MLISEILRIIIFSLYISSINYYAYLLLVLIGLRCAASIESLRLVLKKMMTVVRILIGSRIPFVEIEAKYNTVRGFFIILYFVETSGSASSSSSMLFYLCIFLLLLL